jgi:hypothetical protein
MVAPNPLAARRRTNSSSFSVAVPSSWEESVVSGAIANRFAISRPLLNLKGDHATINQTPDILKLGGIERKPVRCIHFIHFARKRSSSLLKNLEMESFRVLGGRRWNGAVELVLIS